MIITNYMQHKLIAKKLVSIYFKKFLLLMKKIKSFKNLNKIIQREFKIQMIYKMIKKLQKPQ